MSKSLLDCQPNPAQFVPAKQEKVEYRVTRNSCPSCEKRWRETWRWRNSCPWCERKWCEKWKWVRWNLVWWMEMRQKMKLMYKMSQMKWVTWIRINEYEMNVMWWYGYESNEMRRWENESDEWNEVTVNEMTPAEHRYNQQPIALKVIKF